MDFEFFNRSSQEIYVNVHGIRPDPSPGVLVPGGISGTEAVKTAHFGEQVIFGDRITIVWTTDDDSLQKKTEFMRSELGIPDRVNRGTVKITYTEAGRWEVVVEGVK